MPKRTKKRCFSLPLIRIRMVEVEAIQKQKQISAEIYA